MDKLKKALEEFGLSEKEAMVYLTGLKYDSFTIMQIAKETGIKRPTCYMVAEELRKKGLFFEIPRSKKSLYAVEHPRVILNDYQTKLHYMENVIPELEKIIQTRAEKPHFRLFKGVKGMRRIFEDMIKKKNEHLYSIVSTQGMLDAVGDEFMQSWVKKRIKQKVFSDSIRVANDEREDELYVSEKKHLRSITYIDDPELHLPYNIHMYGQNTAFISDTDDMKGFIITSQAFQDTMMSIYNLLKKQNELHKKHQKKKPHNS
ncbi:hypothetical protein KC866_03675 [Patescibacteria group bacterium]|nr:hypothetical protein [Patescibacteria group bacterium]